MELKAFTKHSWRIYKNNRYEGLIIDFGSGYEVQLSSREKPFIFYKKHLKKGELKVLVSNMIEWNEYEIYSEYKLKLRGFTIKS